MHVNLLVALLVGGRYILRLTVSWWWHRDGRKEFDRRSLDLYASNYS